MKNNPSSYWYPGEEESLNQGVSIWVFPVSKELGLTEDELAFYDLLSANQSLINQTGPIQDLVHRVVASVKKNLQLDWTKKEDAKAAIRLAVKKELRGIVQFSALDKILAEVIEQAEGQYGEWPMVA